PPRQALHGMARTRPIIGRCPNDARSGKCFPRRFTPRKIAECKSARFPGSQPLRRIVERSGTMNTKRLLALCIAVLALAAALQAQEGGAGSDKKEVDQRVYKLLKDVINTGADLYNNRNDPNGCYRLYQGSLMTLRPMLEHRPALQKVIDD